MGEANLVVAFHEIVAGLSGQTDFGAIFVLQVFNFLAQSGHGGSSVGQILAEGDFELRYLRDTIHQVLQIAQ